MSTPIPTAAALLHVELGAAQREFTELSPDECMAIAAHFRSLSNTLRSTQEALALCQRSHAEQLARADGYYSAICEALSWVEPDSGIGHVLGQAIAARKEGA